MRVRYTQCRNNDTIYTKQRTCTTGVVLSALQHNPGDALSPKDFIGHVSIPNSSLRQVLGTIIVRTLTF